AAIRKADKLCDRAVEEARRTQLDLPLLDPEVADLLWFAHPFDAKWSILQSMSSAHPLVPMVCTGSESSEIFEVAEACKKKRSRAEESIFNVRCWTEGVESPEGAKEAARNRQSMTKMMMKMMWLK
ncbi:hypothetical protein FOZ62_021483, partial [Perkinsus olseni]